MEREFMDFDVVIVGGGPSGLSAAIKLKQLADQNFRSTSAPSGDRVEEGDTWYDTDDDQFKVYRETSSGNFAWVPIMVGNISPDSDTVDAGSF